MNAGPSVADIAGMLARQAPSLAAELLPNGKREGAEWRVGSLRGEPGRSLSVHLFGSRAGVWSDFASGEAGDALDLVAGVLYGGDKQAAKRAALAWARSWLGLGMRGAAAAPPPPACGHGRARTRSGGRGQAAHGAAIFLAAAPHLAGTPAAGTSPPAGLTWPSWDASPAASASRRICRTANPAAPGQRWWRR